MRALRIFDFLLPDCRNRSDTGLVLPLEPLLLDGLHRSGALGSRRHTVGGAASAAISTVDHAAVCRGRRCACIRARTRCRSGARNILGVSSAGVTLDGAVVVFATGKFITEVKCIAALRYALTFFIIIFFQFRTNNSARFTAFITVISPSGHRGGAGIKAHENDGDDENFAHFQFPLFGLHVVGSRHQFASAPFVGCLFAGRTFRASIDVQPKRAHMNRG
jgi:hypothetical protein